MKTLAEQTRKALAEMAPAQEMALRVRYGIS
jgi:hypothetical protein